MQQLTINQFTNFCLKKQLVTAPAEYQEIIITACTVEVSNLHKKSSEVVITGIVIIIVRVVADVTIFVSFIIIIRLFVIWFKAALSLVLAFRTKASLRFTHLIELGVIFFAIILEYFILLILDVLVLELLDDLLLFGSALAILQVVHIKLVFQVVNVSILLNICAIETLQLGLKPLILLLELRLDVLDSFKTLICAFQLNSSPLDSILKNCFISTQRLDSLLHLLHFARLSINDVPDALLDVLLFSILI